MENNLLLDVESYAVNFITRNVSKDYTFHDLQHTISVVKAANRIGKEMNLTEEELEVLQIAAWFHDLGYDQGKEGHEERGCEYVANFLAPIGYPADKLEKIQNIIRSTQLNKTPNSDLEKIICDADLSHLGKRDYWDRCSRIRDELAATRNKVMSDEEWVDFELDFMLSQGFHTSAAEKLYGDRKSKHILKLERRQKKYQKKESTQKKNKKNKKPTFTDLAGKKSSGKINLKQISLGRGVETMYRTTYRTHINLSSIADNKANIMLSINAIIVSITLSTLVPKFSIIPNLVIPTVVLLSVCLIAIIFATLSTRPKITEGRFTRKNIEDRNANLLFFGNFYNMNLDDYHWGMLEMIKDEDFLYSSMTRDLYHLGVVLAKKYRYLSYCYAVFMYGLIIAVLTFAVVFIIFKEEGS